MPHDLTAPLRESREHAEVRPINAEVEAAWERYAEAFKAWVRILDTSPSSLRVDNTPAEEAKLNALLFHRRKHDEALFEYFEIYDRDQLEAFGGTRP